MGHGPGSDQAGFLQRGLGDQDARAEHGGDGDTIGLGGRERAGKAKSGVAEAVCEIAGFQAEAVDDQLVGENAEMGPPPPPPAPSPRPLPQGEGE